MWRLTIIANMLIMVLCWIISLISLEFAHNRLVQYPSVVENQVSIPLLTEMAFSIRGVSICIPLIWSCIAVFLLMKIGKSEREKRNEIILFYSTITLVIGLAMVAFFSLAGLLSFLFIGATF